MKGWSMAMFRAKSKTLSVTLALVMALLLLAPLGCDNGKTDGKTDGKTQAVQNGYLGLYDLATSNTFRPNTYDADLNGAAEEYTLKIVPIIEDGQGGTTSGWFASAAEAAPSKFQWTQNTTSMDNGQILENTGEAKQQGTDGWYYSVKVRSLGRTLGPDSWHLQYTPSAKAYGDFSFVATDYDAQDSGAIGNIRIEFYDDGGTTPFATGTIGTVNGGDDQAPTGAHGRSYATALDAVARAMNPPQLISDYDKPSQWQMLSVVTDMDDAKHKGDGKVTGWLYGVYYLSSGTTWELDPHSEYIGSDDYLLREGALVIWKIGEIDDYGSDFPSQITR